MEREGGRQYVLEATVHGLRGPIVVKDTPYDAWMPKVAAATHETLARALTHAALTFGDVGGDFKPYTPEEVGAERERSQSPMDTWSHRPKGPKAPTAEHAPGEAIPKP